MSRLQAKYIPLAAVLMVAIAGLSAAACSPGSNNVASSLLAIDVVRAAPEQAEAAGTFRVEYTSRFEGAEPQEGSYDLAEFERGLREADARGELENLDEIEAIHFYLSLLIVTTVEGVDGHFIIDTANNREQRYAESGPFIIEFVNDGSACYSRLRPPSRAQWQRNDECEVETFDLVDVDALFDSIREHGGEVEDLGSSKRGGIDARAYRMVSPIEDSGGMEEEMELWVDDSGRPIRLNRSVVIDDLDFRELYGDATLIETFEFLDYGKPVDIHVPDESEVAARDEATPTAEPTETPAPSPTPTPYPQTPQTGPLGRRAVEHPLRWQVKFFDRLSNGEFVQVADEARDGWINFKHETPFSGMLDDGWKVEISFVQEMAAGSWVFFLQYDCDLLVTVDGEEIASAKKPVARQVFDVAFTHSGGQAEIVVTCEDTGGPILLQWLE